MYEQLLRETERYLERRREIVVPVKQVWDAMVKEGRSNSFSVPTVMADFECLLEGDKRFEFVVAKSAPGVVDTADDDLFEHEELEKLGFSDDQKVKLRRIPLPVREDEDGDPLDSAISFEDLDKELTDTSLFDGAAASAPRTIQKTSKTIARRGKSKKLKESRIQTKEVHRRGTTKAAAKKNSPKKRKK